MKWVKEEKKYFKKLEELSKESPLYHKIDLGDGIITPVRDYENIWNPIKKL